MRQRESYRRTERSEWYSPLLIALFAVFGVMPSGARAQSDVIEREYYDNSGYDNGFSVQYADFIEHDPTLKVEIWTDNESGQYYQGDEIKIYFRVSDDSYVVVYNVDTEGRVNLIYPFDKYDDPYIQSGRIYRIPDVNADYDLVLRGPAGTENIQIIASRTPFPVPDWYQGSNLVSDRDRYEFMEYINGRYFGCRSGCPRALDQVSFVVREWDNYYYRPVYYHPWPYRHHYYGGLYIDYYWGSSIYVDGYFYGIAPLYLPRLSLGYHHVTIYDQYGHGWENRIHINRHDQVHLDKTIIRTGAGVKSRYRSVNLTKYRDPLTNGYPDVRINKKHRPRVIASATGEGKTISRKSEKNSVLATTNDGPVRGFGSKKSYRGSDNSSVIVKNSKRQTVRKSKNSTSESRRLKPYKTSRSKKSSGVRTKASSGSSRKVYKSGGSSRRSGASKSEVSNKRTLRKKSARPATFESRGSRKSSASARSSGSSRKTSGARISRGSSGKSSKSAGVKSKSSGRSKSASVHSGSRSSRGKSSIRSTSRSGRSSSAKSSGHSGRSKGGSRKR